MTLPDLIFAAGLAATLSAMAVPQVLVGLDAGRATAAARYIAARLTETRFEAVRRSADVGVRFDTSDPQYSYTVYVDGNRNGIRARDITRSIDRPLKVAERLADKFGDAAFGIISGVKPVDPGDPPLGTDPVKLGSGDTLTFSPSGTASSGSLYIRGRGQTQLVVRVLGSTGRVRILRFDFSSRAWKPLD